MIEARGQVIKQSISAVITRVDGTQVDLGMIGFYHRNPVFNFIGNVWIKIKRRIKGV